MTITEPPEVALTTGIEVGTGGTVTLGTGTSYPVTITEVTRNGKRVTVRRDNAAIDPVTGETDIWEWPDGPTEAGQSSGSGRGAHHSGRHD